MDNNLKIENMGKYIVRVNIFESYINGIRNSTDYEYIFEEINWIDSRNKAIEMVKELTTFFISGTTNKFTSLLDVQIDEVGVFNAFQIDLNFSPNDGDEYQIFGEEELMIEALAIESSYYWNKKDFQDLTEVVDIDGDIVEVLESNIDFLLN